MSEPTNDTLGERKLGSPEKAREIFNRLWEKSEARRKRQALITRQLNGGKPFSDTELQEMGQGWRTNHNFRDASSMLEQVLVAYWRMLHDVTSIVEVTVHSDDDPDKDEYERIFKKNFDRFMRDWGADYVQNYLLFSQNHVTFGVGVIFWPDRESPRWKAMRTEDTLVKEKAKANLNDLEYIAFRQELDLPEMWDLIRNQENRDAAAAAGWRPGAIRKVLTRYVKKQREGDITTDNEIEVENQLRNTSIGFDNEDRPIMVYHVYVKDYDGKINHVIIPSDYESDEYLFDDYSVADRPESMKDVVTSVFFEVGNGYFYGIKGFGHKNYGTALVLNRLKSRAVDATLTDGLNFRDMSEGTRDIIPITNIGPYNFFPREVEQLPNYPSGTKTLDTIALIDQNLSETNSRYRDQARQVANTDTATQANILASLQNQVDVANATLFLTQMGQNVFQQQMERLRKRGSDDKDAKLFQQRCKEDNLDPKILYDAEIEVRTGADPGTASAAFRAQILQGLMGIAGSNPVLENRSVTESYIVNTLGASAVRKLTSPPDQMEDASSVQKAQLENNAMGDGVPIPVWAKDKHEVHVPYHLQPLQAMVDAYKETNQLNQEHMVALQVALPHVEQHLLYLKKNPLKKEYFQQFWPAFSTINALAEGMFNQVAKMQAQAQQAQAQAPGQERGGDPRQAMPQTAGSVAPGA